MGLVRDLYGVNYKTPHKSRQSKLFVSKGQMNGLAEMTIAEQITQSKTQEKKKRATKPGKVSCFDDKTSVASLRGRPRK